MGILIGLLAGLGLFLVVMSGRPRPPRDPDVTGWRRRTRELLAQAGIPGVTPEQLAALLVFAVSATASLALAFGLFAGRAGGAPAPGQGP